MGYSVGEILLCRLRWVMMETVTNNVEVMADDFYLPFSTRLSARGDKS